jgi:hypothetical protein
MFQKGSKMDRKDKIAFVVFGATLIAILITLVVVCIMEPFLLVFVGFFLVSCIVAWAISRVSDYYWRK